MQSMTPWNTYSWNWRHLKTHTYEIGGHLEKHTYAIGDIAFGSRDLTYNKICWRQWVERPSQIPAPAAIALGRALPALVAEVLQLPVHVLQQDASPLAGSPESVPWELTILRWSSAPAPWLRSSYNSPSDWHVGHLRFPAKFTKQIKRQ